MNHFILCCERPECLVKKTKVFSDFDNNKSSKQVNSFLRTFSVEMAAQHGQRVFDPRVLCVRVRGKTLPAPS